MKIIGITTDNRNVVSDLFKYNDTYGISLNIIIDFIYSKGCVVDWLELYGKMKLSKLVEGIEISDINVKEEIIERIRKCIT